MTRIRTVLAGFAVIVFVLPVMAAPRIGSSASGFPRVGNTTTGSARAMNAALHNAANGATATVTQELHAIKHSLEQADHDYQGHRAKAVQLIGTAIHALHHGQHHTAQAGHGNNQNNNNKGQQQNRGQANNNGNRLPQAQSDAILKSAATSLQGVAQQLNGTPNPGAAKALVAVGQAVQELQTALAIK
jgi:hypothetical protein